VLEHSRDNLPILNKELSAEGELISLLADELIGLIGLCGPDVTNLPPPQ